MFLSQSQSSGGKQLYHNWFSYLGSNPTFLQYLFKHFNFVAKNAITMKDELPATGNISIALLSGVRRNSAAYVANCNRTPPEEQSHWPHDWKRSVWVMAQQLLRESAINFGEDKKQGKLKRTLHSVLSSVFLSIQSLAANSLFIYLFFLISDQCHYSSTL